MNNTRALPVLTSVEPTTFPHYHSHSQTRRIDVLTHFWRPIENVILLWYYTMFTWIKISRARQIDMETNAHS